MSSPRSLVEPVTDRVVHVTALVQVSPARAFAYFTWPDLLTTWLTTTTTTADVDPEVGGRYELFWNPRDREVDSTIGCRITALVADELVAFQWRSGPEWEEPRAWQERAWSGALQELERVSVA